MDQLRRPRLAGQLLRQCDTNVLARRPTGQVVVRPPSNLIRIAGGKAQEVNSVEVENVRGGPQGAELPGVQGKTPSHVGLAELVRKHRNGALGPIDFHTLESDLGILVGGLGNVLHLGGQ